MMSIYAVAAGSVIVPDVMDTDWPEVMDVESRLMSDPDVPTVRPETSRAVPSVMAALSAGAATKGGKNSIVPAPLLWSFVMMYCWVSPAKVITSPTVNVPVPVSTAIVESPIAALALFTRYPDAVPLT